MPRIPKCVANYKLNPGLIIRDKLKVSILLFTTTSPNSLVRVLFLVTFCTFDHPTYRFAMLVNRRNGKQRSSVHFRKLFRYRGNKETWYTAFPNIPLPSWWFLHLFIIWECRTSALWMHIFGIILATTADNLVLKQREWRLMELSLPVLIITIKHDGLILDLIS